VSLLPATLAMKAEDYRMHNPCIPLITRKYLGLTSEEFIRINSSMDVFLDHFLNNVTFFLLPHSARQYQITFICNMLIPVVQRSFLLTSEPIPLTPSEQITESYETLFTGKCRTASAAQLLNKESYNHDKQ
jgi:hypothetical protein